MPRIWIATSILLLTVWTPSPGEELASAATTTALETELRATEQAFAKTMADRDHAGFVSFLSDEAIFVGREVLRGRDAVAAGWKAYFDGPRAPFSWEPSRSLVLASGTLGLSSGPVFNPAGERVGTFQSTWRREADGTWRIVLDSGCPPCDCGGPRGD